MRFQCFDLHSTRSTRLQADKFALIPDISNRFADNSTVVANLEKILQLMISYFQQNLVVGLPSICQTSQASLA